MDLKVSGCTGSGRERKRASPGPRRGAARGAAPAARPALEAAQTPPARASGWLARGPGGAAITNAAAPPRGSKQDAHGVFTQ